MKGNRSLDASWQGDVATRLEICMIGSVILVGGFGMGTGTGTGWRMGHHIWILKRPFDVRGAGSKYSLGGPRLISWVGCR